MEDRPKLDWEIIAKGKDIDIFLTNRATKERASYRDGLTPEDLKRLPMTLKNMYSFLGDIALVLGDFDTIKMPDGRLYVALSPKTRNLA